MPSARRYKIRLVLALLIGFGSQTTTLATMIVIQEEVIGAARLDPRAGRSWQQRYRS